MNLVPIKITIKPKWCASSDEIESFATLHDYCISRSHRLKIDFQNENFKNLLL